jgi:hypothetical protein
MEIVTDPVRCRTSWRDQATRGILSKVCKVFRSIEAKLWIVF